MERVDFITRAPWRRKVEAQLHSQVGGGGGGVMVTHKPGDLQDDGSFCTYAHGVTSIQHFQHLLI